MKRRLAPLAVLLTVLVTVLLAGCTGVPASSEPETVEHFGQGISRTSAPQPSPGVDPRSLVRAFLDANSSAAADPKAARAYLTTEAQNRWLATTVSVVASTQTTQYDSRGKSVTVNGRLVGTIDADGVYTPDVNGEGSGGENVPFQFKIAKVRGEYRIDELRNGLIVPEGKFELGFVQQQVFFYDANEQFLVPDARYTAVTDSAANANWLLQQLVAGPREKLRNALTNVEFPAQSQADPADVQAELGSPTVITVPGAAELDAAHRNRLAAQIARTLDQVVQGGAFMLEDSARPVPIPAVRATRFSAADFPDVVSARPAETAPTTYFIRDGGVWAASDNRVRRLTGSVGTGDLRLDSVAVGERAGSVSRLVAGTAPDVGGRRLLVGTLSRGLRATGLVGPLTRPSWSAGRDEVWLAAGAKVYRSSTAGRVTVVPVPGLPPTGRIIALRASPEGGRLAMVVVAGDTSQLYIGTVARTGGQVRVDNPVPVSPIRVRVDDVAWNDPAKLFLIGVTLDDGEPRITEVQVDGSLWTPQRLDDLPGAPTSITVTENQPAWVSAGDSVWRQSQSGESWVSPTGAGPTAGSNPVYLE